MNPALPKVSIVVPAFNEERYIRDCIESILELEYPADLLEVIAVDNGSTDRTNEILRNYPIRALELRNANVGAVRNFGAKFASGQVLVFLDADCIVESDWLKKGVIKLLNSDRLVLGGQYLLRENPSWFEKYWILNSSKNRVYLTTLVGGCIFIRAEVFNAVHGFDESLRSGEDSELTVRLIDNGDRVEIDPKLSVVHLGFPSALGEFVARQIWHSSDYITNLPKSLNDKVFLATILFFLGILIASSSVVFLNTALLLVGLVLSTVPPAALSLKRILRSEYKVKSLRSLLSIFLIDTLYLVGRCIGTAKSLIYWVKS